MRILSFCLVCGLLPFYGVSADEKKVDPIQTVKATEIAADYEKSDVAADKKYDRFGAIKKMVVEGEVKEVQRWKFGGLEGWDVVLKGTDKVDVHMRFDNLTELGLKAGDKVRIEGTFQGPPIGDKTVIDFFRGKVLKDK